MSKEDDYKVIDRYTIEMAGTRLPRPTGEMCPDHPGYALVWKLRRPYCRRGAHYVQYAVRERVGSMEAVGE